MTLSVPNILKRHPRVIDALHAAGLVEAFSSTTTQELACIERHASGSKAAVEIGTAMGVSAARIARAMAPDGILYCVDPYPAYQDPMWRICRRVLRRHGLSDKVRFVRFLSAEAAFQLPSRCDFFFVDGDHSGEGLATDWKIVKDHLIPGGVACFHDTTVPPEDRDRRHGSVAYFQEVILHDPQFVHVETCYSLNVMRREHAA